MSQRKILLTFYSHFGEKAATTWSLSSWFLLFSLACLLVAINFVAHHHTQTLVA
jgi:hypothetical protein